MHSREHFCPRMRGDAGLSLRDTRRCSGFCLFLWWTETTPKAISTFVGTCRSPRRFSVWLPAAGALVLIYSHSEVNPRCQAILLLSFFFPWTRHGRKALVRAA